MRKCKPLKQLQPKSHTKKDMGLPSSLKALITSSPIAVRKSIKWVNSVKLISYRVEEWSFLALMLYNFNTTLKWTSNAETNSTLAAYHLLNTSISWYFDFSWYKTSSTSSEKHCPGQSELNSENQPLLIASIRYKARNKSSQHVVLRMRNMWWEVMSRKKG